MSEQKLSVGRIVHYRLSSTDAERIEARRAYARAKSDPDPPGGNTVRAGDVVPLIVVHPWSDVVLNGQAILDGNDTYWVTSAEQGDGTCDGRWFWPPRV